MIINDTIEKIKATARIEEVAADFYTLTKQGASLYTKCPKCDKEGKGKGLIFTPKKQIYKCFSCDFAGKSPINFLMDTQQMTYPEALKYLADKYHITIVEEEKPKGPQIRKSKKGHSFCDQQLKASGLDEKDITATTVLDDNTEKLIPTYQAGTRDQYGRIVPGDDMIIYYYNLEGKPVLYQKDKTTRFEQLYRVRWQFPEHHLDKSNRPIKYQSPAKSGSHLYIPEPVRQIYRERRVIKRLFIQEGEKKADKATKHGITSVGIMGIHNIAQDGRLPYDLQLIVQACHVEEVIFMLDADWDQLGDNLKPGDRIDQRTYSFYRAVVNFRDYLKAFNNHGIYLETYFGYPKHNENNDKGIDDVLVNTFPGNEIELLRDIERAINDIKEKDGEGKHVQLHRITTLSEQQIMQFWGFESSKTFLKKHQETLLRVFPNGEIFKLGKNKLEWHWDSDKEAFTPAQPLTTDEQYWEEIKWEDARGVEKKKIQFDYVNLRKFLKNRGYGKLLMANGKYHFIHAHSKIVRNVEAAEIKDYVVEFTEEVASKDVQNMILRGGKMYLGPDSLGNMYKIYPTFEAPRKESQNLYFQGKYWSVNSESIEEKSIINLENSVWADKIIDFDASLSKPLLKIDQVTEEVIKESPDQFKHFLGQFEVEFTETGKQSHFLQFIHNTSEFAWRKMYDMKTRQALPDTRTIDEKFETNMHLMSKLTAIGYLLHDYHNKSIAKMIIAMDGKMSEVGQSNGRSGKSIIGMYIGKLIPQVYIAGKQKNLTEDPFLMEGVTEKTKSVFIDDTRTNIDIEFFYPHLTGQFTVRGLGQAKFNLPEDQKPKFYVSTNHGINDAGGSLRDRVFMLAFSDFYNENHKPIDDFGINFFDDWDQDQWSLSYNLAATCLQLYFRYGLVKAPLRRLELRNLRQEMGEAFLDWADEFYSNPANLGSRIPRQELSDKYLEKVPTAKRFYTPHNFKKKLKSYAEFRGYHFNPDLFDKEGNPKKFDNKGRAIDYDKSGGTEYITIAAD
ncbi:MAG: DNA primase [Bacteroidales bacterium]|nr:DNA primase [Bacteroidales bacterium]